jgi:hypothetical protein
MSIARLLDVRHGDGVIVAPNLNQEHYVNWVRFLRHCNANGLCSIVASNYGSGGTGEDFHDGANPAGENAWIYAEFLGGAQRFGILVQWADASSFGSAPGNPGRIAGSTSDGVAVAMALVDDGSSPWAGTTNDNGADTKGDPVWTPGTSTVFVFPRSNAPGGAHNTSRENMCRVGLDDTSGYSRAHWAANENGIVQLFSVDDGGSYVAMYAGRYTPRSGLTALTRPYCMVYNQSSSFWEIGDSTVYGSTAGNTVREGGIVGRVADDVMSAAIDVVQAGQHVALYQPNQLITPQEFEGGAIAVYQREALTSLAGFLPTGLLFAVFNATNHQTDAAATKAYLGITTQAAYKWAVSWDGSSPPGTVNDRLGRLSFTL